MSALSRFLYCACDMFPSNKSRKHLNLSLTTINRYLEKLYRDANPLQKTGALQQQQQDSGALALSRNNEK